MRTALANTLGRSIDSRSAHPGLLYERYVPLIYGDETAGRSDRKVPDVGHMRSPEDQDALLRHVTGIPMSAAYRVAWHRWRRALQESRAVMQTVEATSRLLLGHGNPAPTEVGITLHHVYGVPLLPGTALKGLLNHYLATWGAATDAEWKGVQYDAGGRPQGAPGVYHRAIFGAPNLPLGESGEQEGKSGGVVFEDAWLVPSGDDYPLCSDVLTPHQKEYYRNFGAEPPNDWTDPNPVTFLTVKPKMRFLVAISPASAQGEGAELAMRHLLDALEQWGVGAKTRAGYGRLHRIAEEPAGRMERAQLAGAGMAASAAPLTEALQSLKNSVSAVLNPPNRDQAPPIAERLARLITDDLLNTLSPSDYTVAQKLLTPLVEHAGLRKRRKDRLDEILKKVIP
ncbi:type III-B CRISPR module RAMP protein Cmr6 [uncultured Thiodictyon sp.]|uniref:type III-B CRISPR module RAMP protein Cmr6 n=1 Tax=uncultured Thiodictyon sp. TaxID=1846217 RepID=UPI0025F4424E|nr:type III-B CRISPR module RAMP protein Cmr6 [uncultured Thiodictyon sp.]